MMAQLRNSTAFHDDTRNEFSARAVRIMLEGKALEQRLVVCNGYSQRFNYRVFSNPKYQQKYQQNAGMSTELARTPRSIRPPKS